MRPQVTGAAAGVSSIECTQPPLHTRTNTSWGEAFDPEVHSMRRLNNETPSRKIVSLKLKITSQGCNPGLPRFPAQPRYQGSSRRPAHNRSAPGGDRYVDHSGWRQKSTVPGPLVRTGSAARATTLPPKGNQCQTNSGNGHSTIGHSGRFP